MARISHTFLSLLPSIGVVVCFYPFLSASKASNCEGLSYI